jgi:polar amino acid transport system substrate-binding protein
MKGLVRLGVDHRPAALTPSDYEVRRDDGFQGVVAESLSHLWGITVELVVITPSDRVAALQDGRVDALFVRTGIHDALSAKAETIDAGYETALAPIMRSDTDIASWPGLRGRKVCIAQGNEAAHTIASRYGAQVEIKTAPAKALAAMRTGDCDAVIDDAEVVRRILSKNLDRWYKFSATLPSEDWQKYVFATAEGDLDSKHLLQGVVREWRRQGQWTVWIWSWATDVDFEEYLEQDAPDCH